MTTQSGKSRIGVVSALFVLAAPVCFVGAQTTSSQLPATAPTSLSNRNAMAPITAAATPDGSPGLRTHRGQVSCAGGQLRVHAENSSLNGILRSISRCTGMQITGGVLDQRVFGDYGPAAPATVLATLLDGTGTNMLLQETATDQPAHLFLTPRIGGPTLPTPSTAPDTDTDEANSGPEPQPGPQPGPPPGPQPGPQPNRQPGANQSSPSASAQGTNGPPNAGNGNSAQTSGTDPSFATPASMPQGFNNVSGDARNVDLTVSNLPTVNSVPVDSLPTPSSAPPANGIVVAPNPPAAGSDTSRVWGAAFANAQAGASNTNTPVSDTNAPATATATPTSNTSSPGATNTATPAAPNTGQPGGGTNSPSGIPTPQQIYQQQQQQQQKTPPQ